MCDSALAAKIALLSADFLFISKQPSEIQIMISTIQEEEGQRKKRDIKQTKQESNQKHPFNNIIMYLLNNIIISCENLPHRPII